MSEPLWNQPRTVFQALVKLSAERAKAETTARTHNQEQKESGDAAYQQACQAIHGRHHDEKATAEAEFQQSKQAITKEYETARREAEEEFNTRQQEITAHFNAAREKAEKQFQETRWALTTVLDVSRNGENRVSEELQEQVKGVTKKVIDLQDQSTKLLQSWRQYAGGPPEDGPANTDPITGDVLRDMENHLALAENHFTKVKALVVPRFFAGIKPFWLFVFLIVTTSGALLWKYPEGKVEGKYQWWIVSLGGSLLIWIAICALLYCYATIRTMGASRPMWGVIGDARALYKRFKYHAAKQRERDKILQAKIARKKEKHERTLDKVAEKYRKLMVRTHDKHKTYLRRVENKFQQKKTDYKTRYDQAMLEANEKYLQTLEESKQVHDADFHQAQEKYAHHQRETHSRQDQLWTAATKTWEEGLSKAEAGLAAIDAETQRWFPPWDSEVWRNWQPPAEVPTGMRFGNMFLTMGDIPNGIPLDERLRQGPMEFSLPAFLSFPHRCSFLMEAGNEGRNQAVSVLQAVMMRMLTSIPPGKVRFTIIDPVGLGENFAAFMNLADYDDALVASRIWTEPLHIEQRLGDLTEHIENVIQKYLRNQFETIEEYNVQAGEVAEPFRVLVVANFPVNFSLEACRRLVSIASSGARCGVYTLVGVDTNQPSPQGFNLADLEQTSCTLVWKNRKFTWRDSDFEKFPLELESPPASSEFNTRILQLVGERAREAKRVEVPFDFIAPRESEWWTGDSSGIIDVPIGRSGATKRQYLKLGKGTSQHVLIAGKTGSGKSTLLHALITNLAMMYSSEEVELYLVDFKKGVEFKTYATHRLPHARVIAIESEREFGLSVLQRLDAELKIRGDRFRDMGVQDVKSFRQAAPGEPLPRILLIVDEFQEFFIEDDKIAQEASLLMDRLVRQGRAFGIHILLGSQTLGGAYSLARSTLDQMAVRMVLQCSEADAHLVLSKDNSAARLLSRPGEAIYNDANGLIEGNNPFQVAWLADSKKDEYLRGIRVLADSRANLTARPQIVFEGNAPAQIDKNHLLHEILAAPTWPAAAPAGASAWLGEAIAIKDPTAAVFRPQSGSNILMIGQQDEPALGILACSLIGLAAQYAPREPGGPKFYVLDGAPQEGPQAALFTRLGEALPHPLRVAGWRDLAAVMTDIAGEVDRRQKANDFAAPPMYLFINGLQRFRDLRRQEDDFGFSRRGAEQPPTPSKQFATILKEGPGVGVFTFLWCDSLNNVNRALDRQGMKEFEMRILFQMSAADSSTLIDAPTASKLGMHRALYYTEDRGQAEKFRPYGVPSEEWLKWIKEQFARKG